MPPHRRGDQADHAMARDIIGDEHFKEVYVSTPISVYEQRDSKKLLLRHFDTHSRIKPCNDLRAC